MELKNKIIIVADDNDKSAARVLMVHLAQNHQIEASLFTSHSFRKKEPEISNKDVLICIGGPNYNPITREYLDAVTIVKKDKKISIALAGNIALVYGNREIPSTKNAVQIFIKEHLNDFIEENFNCLKDYNEDTSFYKPIENIAEPIPESTESEEPKPLLSKNSFFCSGNKVWIIIYEGVKKNFVDALGFRYMHYIISRPYQSVSLSELDGAIKGSRVDNSEYELDFQAEMDNENIRDNMQEDEEYENKAKKTNYHGTDPVIHSKRDLIDDEDYSKPINLYKKNVLRLSEKRTAVFQEIDDLKKALSALKLKKDYLGKLLEEKKSNPTSSPSERVSIIKEIEICKLEAINLEKKLEKHNNEINRIGRDIELIDKEIKNLFLKQKIRPREQPPEKIKLKNAIRNNILLFYKALEKEGLQHLVKHLKASINVYNGYQYDPVEGSGDWILNP